MTRERSRFLAAALALALGVVPALASAQGVGRVTGRVVDQATNAPITQAQIVVVGTTLGGRTDDSGNYTIVGVPAGQQQLRVLRLGYASQTVPVMVTADQTTTANFSLEQQALTLDVVVTTATGEQQRTRESGATVAQINTDELNKAAITNFSEVLSSRASGVVVQTSGGTTGNGSRIRIRGSNSISLNNDPIIIIDGIRVENSSSSTAIGVGGQQPSRFNDLNPEDIENIEIIKGPAAAALYGTAAANGVIQVTTKRGRAGKTQWNAFAEGGNIYEVTEYPANYEQLGLDVSGNTIFCPTYRQGQGRCTPTTRNEFNPLEEASPFRTGYRTQFGVSAAGGTERATYYVAGDVEREQGIYEPNLLDRMNLRANLTGQLSETFKVQASTGYMRSELGRPQNDNNTWGIVSGGLLGTAEFNERSCGYYNVCPEKLFAIDTRQFVDRFTTSFNANWNPLSWLTANGTAGLDWTRREDRIFIEPGIWTPDEDPDAAVGFREVDPYDLYTYTANGNLTAAFVPMPDLTSNTSVGLQWNREAVHGISAYGQNFTPGIGSLEGANALFSIGEASSANVTLGAYISQQFGWRDRLFATAAIRTDNNSAFGNDFGWVYYPAASLSWVIGEEPWFPQQDWVSSLRIRTAYGQSGQRPSFRDATTFFSAVTASIVDNTGTTLDIPALVVGGTGNAELRPEKSAEYEIGFDAGILDDRARIELTYYNKTTNDALVQRRLAPSLGVSNSRFENIGEVNNQGLEALVDARVYESDMLGLDFTLTASTNKNELIELGEGVTPIIFGLGGDSQRHQEGYPLGGYWQRPILGYADANGDGIIGLDEVEVGPDPVYLGTPFPKYEFTFRPRLTIMRNIQVSALIDHRGGHKLLNGTADFRCASFVTCRAVNDASAPLVDQANAMADILTQSVAGYIEDADFTKLRELAVELRAPEDWAGRLGVTGLSLTLAGRNLATWTDYKGFDPELNVSGQANFNQADFLTQPPVRYYTARLNVSF